jgi:ADP-ribose pyrophosphatase YjhB (NUDIX family)
MRFRIGTKVVPRRRRPLQGRRFFIEGSPDMDQKNYIAWIRSHVGDEKIILNAACVVIPDAKGRILLQKRSDNGKWGMPGGLLELDEPIATGAIREVREETNLEVRLTGFVGVFVNPSMTWRERDRAEVVCFSFTGESVAGELRVNDGESLAFDWFGPDEIPEIHSSDNLATIKAYFAGERNLVEGRRYS